jgi:hypothetical protein
MGACAWGACSHHLCVCAAAAALLAMWTLHRSPPKGSANALVLLLASLALAQSTHRIPPSPGFARLRLPTPTAEDAHRRGRPRVPRRVLQHARPRCGPRRGVRRWPPWKDGTARAVHAYSLVGNDSCIGGGSSTLTAHFALQAVRAGLGASKGTPPASRGTLGTSSYARRTRPRVVQGAAVGTLPLCAAACDLRGECVAFSHTTARTGGICTLHGTLHEGLIPQFNTLGEFTLDSHHTDTEQARHSQYL